MVCLSAGVILQIVNKCLSETVFKFGEGMNLLVEHTLRFFKLMNVRRFQEFALAYADFGILNRN